MRKLPLLLTVVSATLAAPLTGCSTQRAEMYDKAMRATVADLRSGDIDGASVTLDAAREYADNKAQREKVTELGTLIDGAKAYCGGDRSQAGATWSGTKTPEFRSAIASRQGSLGVELSPAKGN